MNGRNSPSGTRNRTSLLARILVTTFALSAPACVSYPAPHPLSAAQLAERGTHRYPGVDREKATEACAAALATLGYDVTIRDAAQGLVKTAPKTMQTILTGNEYYAHATQDGLAWSIAVEDSGAGAVVHATPRAFRDGSQMRNGDVWVAEAIDDKFQDLWHEVDETLKVANTRN